MKKYNGEYVIVRGSRSGVFAGNIIKREGSEVELVNCRRLWYWDGACSINQLAYEGTKKADKCKFTVIVDKIEILDTIEIIPCTEQAEQSIKDVKEWKI